MVTVVNESDVNDNELEIQIPPPIKVMNMYDFLIMM